MCCIFDTCEDRGGKGMRKTISRRSSLGVCRRNECPSRSAVSGWCSVPSAGFAGPTCFGGRFGRGASPPPSFLAGTSLFALTAISLLATLLAVAHAAGTPAFVQRKYARVTSGTAVAATFAKPNRAGDLIVVYVVWDNDGPVSLTDTRGNTYASAIGPTRSTDDRTSAQLFYARNVAAGSNRVTAHFETAVAAEGAMYVHEYSGIDTVSAVDAAVAASGSSVSMDSGLLTTGSANALLFAAAESNRSVTRLG